ncbi:MAG: hypothetical protein RLZZ05_408, partial [Bacteroidota bacterium]
MKGNILYVMGLLSLGLIMTGCGKSSKSSGSVGDGQLRGVSLGSKYIMPKPPGMIYVP